MKRTIVSMLLVLALCAGCSKPLSVSPTASALTPTPTVTAPVTYTLPQADDILSCNIYGKVQAQTGNTFFSPFSIITCLSMAQEGAANTTATQMQSVLNLNPNAAARQQGFQQLLSELSSFSASYTFDMADNIWVQQGFGILPSYTSTLQTYYDAGAANVDFVGNPTGAVNTVNTAVSQETGGFIPAVLSPSDVNANTRLVLTNAVYFQSNWQNQFPVVGTDQETFNLTATTTETVSMMHVTFPANLGNFNGAASVLAIPYQNNKASMYVFLPTNGITALESGMTGANLTSWLASNSANLTNTGATTPIALSFPKFSYSTSYDLTAALEQAGMTLPFIQGQANFSGIDGQQDLSISKVIHQASVNVVEGGTTATAATVIIVPVTGIAGLPGPPTTPFVVNQPFIFAIVDNTTNTVLFMGQVNQP